MTGCAPARRLAAAGLALLGGLTGCAGGDEPDAEHDPTVLSLLTRAPDVVLDELGTVSPSDTEVWPRSALLGWETAAADVVAKRGVAWSTLPTALVNLPAGVPAARTVTLTLRAPARTDGLAVHLTASLNDVELRSAPISERSSELVLEAPAAVWRKGDNVLALSVDRMGDGPRTARGVGLEAIAYGDPAQVTADLEAPRLQLGSGSGVRYLLERSGTSELVVGGRSDGAGMLAVDVGHMDPRDSSLAQHPGGHHRFRVAGGAFEESVELPAPGGEVLSVELTWTSETSGGRPTAPATLTRLETRGGLAPRRPPIVFISIDTLAARNMSLYGYERATTPALQRWASEHAMEFARCKANAPWTVPSYTSQLTGLYPHSNGLSPEATRATIQLAGRSPLASERYQVAPNRWTLAELLRAAGYRTAAIIDNLYLGQIIGVSQGFEHFDDGPARVSIDDTDGGMRMVFPRALDWLGTDRGDEPFFLFLQILDCHAPYRAVAPWKGAFDDTASGPGGGGTAPVVDYNTPVTFGTVIESVARSLVDDDDPLPEHVDTTALVQAYDEKVREVDAVVGEFLDALSALPFYDEAVVVVSADHGESMDDYEALFRHSTVRDEVLHVPLLVKMPFGVNAGKRIDDVVQLVDLYATFADFAGLDPNRDYLHGRSLVGRLEGADLPAHPAVGQGDLLFQNSIEIGGWKLVRYLPKSGLATLLTHPRLSREFSTRYFDFEESAPLEPFVRRERAQRFEAEHADAVAAMRNDPSREEFRYELFDLGADPTERNDVSAQHPERVAQLTELLERELALTEAARATASFSPLTTELGVDEREELRRLGYLDD